MDFIRSHFGKMQLGHVEHFFSTIQAPFCEEKSVQIVKVAFFQSDFLQNPYFSVIPNHFLVPLQHSLLQPLYPYTD